MSARFEFQTRPAKLWGVESEGPLEIMTRAISAEAARRIIEQFPRNNILLAESDYRRLMKALREKEAMVRET